MTAHLKLDEMQHLPNKVELAVGMKAMVLMNIATGADLANGSRGIITGIVLDPTEPVHDNSASMVYLHFPPVVVLFLPTVARKITLRGLPEGTIPIFLTHRSLSLGGNNKIVIDQDQLALTAAYAFMDFKSQGQTIECVIVDLAKPRGFGFFDRL